MHAKKLKQCNKIVKKIKQKSMYYNYLQYYKTFNKTAIHIMWSRQCKLDKQQNEREQLDNGINIIYYLYT